MTPSLSSPFPSHPIAPLGAKLLQGSGYHHGGGGHRLPWDKDARVQRGFAWQCKSGTGGAKGL